MPIPSFFFNNPATTEIYTLSLHDALPIFGAERTEVRRHSLPVLQVAEDLRPGVPGERCGEPERHARRRHRAVELRDRKSTRLNSSHSSISYAVFCLKKKKKKVRQTNK